jgi:hypothetical protein
MPLNGMDLATSETSHVSWSTHRVFGAFATRDSSEFCYIGLLATQTKLCLLSGAL